MIDFFKTWLPQIIGYAEMIVDGTLRKAWETGDKSQTSTYYSGELDEQIFDDLDAHDMRWEMRSRLQDRPQLVERIELFLQSLSQLVAWTKDEVDTRTWGSGKAIPVSVSAIFSSKEWQEVETLAAELLAAAEASGFSSGDFNPL